MLTFKEYNEALRLSDVEEWEKRFLRSVCVIGERRTSSRYAMPE